MWFNQETVKMLNFNTLVATDTSVEGGSMELSKKDIQLIHFLPEKLTISTSSIAIALRRRQQNSEPLPMILWQ
jgi:hypothetical protein